VIKGSKQGKAKISLDGVQVAEIRKGENMTFKLVSMGGHEWTLTKKVHGEFRPFSISIFDQSKEVLTILEHLFKHKGRFYMLTNHPEGRHWNDYHIAYRNTGAAYDI